jgi:DNA-binding NtrC family response regulator
MSHLPMHGSYPTISTPPEPHAPTPQPPSSHSQDSAAPSVRRVLVIADRPGARQLIGDDVRKRGLNVCEAESVHEAMRLLDTEVFSACVIDDADQVSAVRDLADRCRVDRVPTQLICLVPENSEWGRDVFPSFDCDIVEKPYSPARLGTSLLSALRYADLLGENERLKSQVLNRNLFDLVGTTPAIESLRESIRIAADDDRTVLVRGEKGTGTNLVAQGLHRCSRRGAKAFIRIDCALHSAETLEQLLIGTEMGEEGYLSTIIGGTLFLDNVECIAVPMQRKLARIIQNRQFTSLATGQTSPLEVRLVAATHADLIQCAAAGQFRDDLLSCLSGVTIQTPPLRVRREDVPLLTEYFLNCVAVQEGRPCRLLTTEALERLRTYDWPGNVRELRNVIERACSVDLGAELRVEDLETWMSSDNRRDEFESGMTLREMERKLIESTFARCGGNRERTASILRIGLRTLSGKLREYGYPPRGGPGSNIKPHQQRKAA